MRHRAKSGKSKLALVDLEKNTQHIDIPSNEFKY